MSITVMSYVFAMELPIVDKMVMLCLADHAHDDGSRVYPSVANLAKKASLGTTATRASLRRMEAAGYLVEVEPGGGRHRPTRYRLDVDLLRNPTSREGFTNPTSHDDKPNASRPESGETQRLTTETQRPGVAEPSEPSVNLEPSGNRAPTLSTRPRDLIFEVLFSLETGENYSPEASASLTRTARGALNTAAADVRRTGTSPEELIVAIAAWPTLFDDATCTPTGVARHLSKLKMTANGHPPRGARRREPTLEEKLRAMEGAQ